MKIPWTAVSIVLLIMMMVNTAIIALPSVKKVDLKKKTYSWNLETENLVKERVAHLKLPFNVNYESEITSNIKEYVTYGRRDAELIIGKTKLYFPIFEHNLRLQHLPLELKYLPIIESKLNPTVKSPVGAAGLWQFTISTGKFYKLQIDRTVDERLDPYRSTEAAVQLLKRLYSEYCDWAVVLAAYNCGTVRVNKAIQLAGSASYQDIKRYLPTETRKYIPRFVAAAYIANYFDEHGITPKIKSYHFGEIRTLKLTDQISFDKIETISETERYIIKKLNPGYLKEYIPASKNGRYLTMPADALKKIAHYIQS